MIVSDCLRGADHERLHAACSRPNWTVASDEFYTGHYFTSFCKNASSPTWCLRTCHSTAQLELTGLVQYIVHRRYCGISRSEPILHPWQAEPPLPVNINIDVSHHHPQSLPAPVGWDVIQRNGRIWMVEQHNRVVKLDEAQYHMLLAMHAAPTANATPTAQFLVSVSASCRAQKAADRVYHVPWSRHLLANLRWQTGCELLVGASAVTYNPHFPYFVSPHPVDECLGAVKEWPPVPALLVIDSFAPHLRGSVLEQVVAHRPGVWILKQHDGNTAEPLQEQLRRVASLQADSPRKSR